MKEGERNSEEENMRGRKWQRVIIDRMGEGLRSERERVERGEREGRERGSIGGQSHL